MTAPFQSALRWLSATMTLALVITVCTQAGVTTAQAAALVVAGLALAGWLVHRDLAWLFGPVFFYDLVRTARSGRHHVFRCLYGMVLLVVLYLFFESWSRQYSKDWWDMFSTLQMPRDEVPRFAERFFHAFLVVQFAVVLVVTPGYTAGAIAEEKETRTLEYLLATDLHSREIILGKLFSRLGNMVLLVLAGLPILSLTLFFGGVDPFGLLVGYAGTLLMILSTGGLSILVSVQSKRTLNAVLASYLWIAGFLVCCPFMPPLTLAHPVCLWSVISHSQDVMFLPGISWEAVLAVFASAHLLVAAFCTFCAVEGLRPAALRYRPGEGWKPPLPRPPIPLPRRPAEPVVLMLAEDGLSLRPIDPPGELPEGSRRPSPAVMLAPIRPEFNRPPVGDNAMRWKEFYAEPTFGSSDLGSFLQGINIIFCVLLVTLMLLAQLVLAEQNLWGPAEPRWVEFTRQGSFLARLAGTVLATLLMLGVGITASMTVSRERERQTLDSLLTTPLELREILGAKLLGSFFRMRALGGGLLLVWGLGFLTGAVHVMSLAALLVALAVFAGFFAALGIWFSTVCPSTARATLMTVLASLVFLAGSWVMAGQFTEIFRGLGVPFGVMRVLDDIQEFGLSPPAALVALSFPIALNRFPPQVAPALIGVAFYAVLGMALWRTAAARIRKETCANRA